jgi:hypothetical protein
MMAIKKSWLIPILIVAILAVAAAGFYGIKAQAQEEPKVDLGNAILQVDQVEYYLAPTYNNAADNVHILFELTNKAGKDVALEPVGQLTLKGASGKEYPKDFINKNQDYFDLGILSFQNEHTQKLVNLGKAKAEDILPDGLYRWSYCVSIDRGDKITSIIYRNGSEVKELDISIFKVITHERPSAPGPEDLETKK